jgi:hypothetical protein
MFHLVPGVPCVNMEHLAAGRQKKVKTDVPNFNIE